MAQFSASITRAVVADSNPKEQV